MFTYYTYKRHFRKKAIKTQIKAHNHKNHTTKNHNHNHKNKNDRITEPRIIIYHTITIQQINTNEITKYHKPEIQKTQGRKSQKYG